MATQSHRGEVSNAVSSAAPDSIYIRSTFGRSLWGTKTLRATGSRWDIGTDMASNYHLRDCGVTETCTFTGGFLRSHHWISVPRSDVLHRSRVNLSSVVFRVTLMRFWHFVPAGVQTPRAPYVYGMIISSMFNLFVCVCSCVCSRVCLCPCLGRVSMSTRQSQDMSAQRHFANFSLSVNTV